MERFYQPNGTLIERTATHAYYAPHLRLRPYIAHYTLQFPSRMAAPVTTLTLVPDASGCLVFRVRGGRVESFCWGATTHTVTVDASPQSAEGLLFVEFLPGGGRRLTEFPQKELADRRIELALMDRVLAAQVEDLLETARDTAALVKGLDQIFLQRLAHFSDCNDLPGGLNAIPFLTVREVAQSMCYSQRQAGRIFQEQLGIGVKAYLRILRVNRVLKLLVPGVSLTRVAQDAGYYDQSHLDHDFKAVCGVCPTTYLNRLSDFYKEPLKFLDNL